MKKRSFGIVGILRSTRCERRPDAIEVSLDLRTD